MKFGRTCQLSLEVAAPPPLKSQNLTLASPPLTIDFDVNRQSLSSASNATFVIKNLNSQETRDLIYKDRYNITQYRAVQFRAGYDGYASTGVPAALSQNANSGSGRTQPLLFNGNIFSAYSEKISGTDDSITTIECQDGGFARVNGLTTTTVSGKSTQQILSDLAASLPMISGRALISLFSGGPKRGFPMIGSTWDLLQQLSGGKAIIDNNQVKILADNDVVDGDLLVINRASGLLGSPRRSDSQIEFDMLFEPRLTIGQYVKLDSVFNSILNGIYKVMGLHHRGTISPRVAGEPARTTVSLWLGDQALNWQNPIR